MANAYKGETLDAITLEGVQITNKNFSGTNGRFDDGKRTFTVKLSKDDSERLNRLGWDVNLVDGYNPGDPPIGYMNVQVKYDRIPAKVWTVIESEGNMSRSLRTEETVGALDNMYVKSADLVIGGSVFSSGVGRYLRTGYFVIGEQFEDPFAEKYGYSADEDCPF